MKRIIAVVFIVLLTGCASSYPFPMAPSTPNSQDVGKEYLIEQIDNSNWNADWEHAVGGEGSITDYTE